MLDEIKSNSYNRKKLLSNEDCAVLTAAMSIYISTYNPQTKIKFKPNFKDAVDYFKGEFSKVSKEKANENLNTTAAIIASKLESNNIKVENAAELNSDIFIQENELLSQSAKNFIKERNEIAYAFETVLTIESIVDKAIEDGRINKAELVTEILENFKAEIPEEKYNIQKSILTGLSKEDLYDFNEILKNSKYVSVEQKLHKNFEYMFEDIFHEVTLKLKIGSLEGIDDIRDETMEKCIDEYKGSDEYECEYALYTQSVDNLGKEVDENEFEIEDYTQYMEDPDDVCDKHLESLGYGEIEKELFIKKYCPDDELHDLETAKLKIIVESIDGVLKGALSQKILMDFPKEITEHVLDDGDNFENKLEKADLTTYQLKFLLDAYNVQMKEQSFLGRKLVRRIFDELEVISENGDRLADVIDILAYYRDLTAKEILSEGHIEKTNALCEKLFMTENERQDEPGKNKHLRKSHERLIDFLGKIDKKDKLNSINLSYELSMDDYCTIAKLLNIDQESFNEEEFTRLNRNEVEEFINIKRESIVDKQTRDFRNIDIDGCIESIKENLAYLKEKANDSDFLKYLNSISLDSITLSVEAWLQNNPEALLCIKERLEVKKMLDCMNTGMKIKKEVMIDYLIGEYENLIKSGELSSQQIKSYLKMRQLLEQATESEIFDYYNIKKKSQFDDVQNKLGDIIESIESKTLKMYAPKSKADELQGFMYLANSVCDDILSSSSFRHFLNKADINKIKEKVKFNGCIEFSEKSDRRLVDSTKSEESSNWPKSQLNISTDKKECHRILKEFSSNKGVEQFLKDCPYELSIEDLEHYFVKLNVIMKTLEQSTLPIMIEKTVKELPKEVTERTYKDQVLGDVSFEQKIDLIKPKLNLRQLRLLLEKHEVLSPRLIIKIFDLKSRRKTVGNLNLLARNRGRNIEKLKDDPRSEYEFLEDFCRDFIMTDEERAKLGNNATMVNEQNKVVEEPFIRFKKLLQDLGK